MSEKGSEQEDLVSSPTGPASQEQGAPSPRDIQLKKSINVVHCVAILVAVTGHIAVFTSPAAILNYSGSVGMALVMWLVGGLLNLCLALCFTELAVMLPVTGGAYAYITHIFGPLPGFMIMWGYLVMISAPFWAYIAYTAALYLTQPFFPNCTSPDLGVKLLAAWIIITFVAVNCVYMKFVTKIQTLLAGTKLLSLLFIIVCGSVAMSQGNTENLKGMMEGTSQDPSKIAMTFFYSIFTYGGWQILTNLMEEVKNPSRDLPRAVYLNFFILTTACVLVNLAYVVVLTPQEIIHSDAIAVFFFSRIHPSLMPVISVLVAVTAIGVLNASILGHSRVLLAGARKKQMPAALGMISIKYLTPWPAIFTNCILSLVMLFSGGLMIFMDFISLFSAIMSLTVVVALLYLRWTQPDRPRPYKPYLFIPLSMLVLTVAILCLAAYQSPARMGVGLAVLAAGFPVYWLGVTWQNKPKQFLHSLDAFTSLIQKAFNVRKSS